ncbi:hypothetical protein, conserved [Eimeria maxima]|uniref:Uncharacterized protein n=1 Tax=Eimeria maxima TaxID=5804 RepID=U6M425_EIMMA|nr:hypothetical protein, conserved [Eimeria maxima]CDJ58766.1 hypothetical protein, conserved [Eimeria maxima]
MERQPQKAPQPTHSFACNERLQTHAKKAAVSAAAVQLFFQDGVDNKNGDITVAVSSKRSSPSADRSSSSSSSSSSKKYNSQFHSQKWDYQQTSWLMESRETQEKMLQKDAPERHESQQGGGDLPQNHLPANTSSFSSSICIGSGRGSRGCACIGGLAEGTDPSSLRLQAHASAPLSLIYLRLSDAPQLSEEVEKKLRAFIGFVESDANSHRQQQKTEYNVSVPQLQQQQRQQQEHPFFADYLPKDVKQQQEVERALRHILFAVVEMATARQFHLPPPSVSHQLYGYDIIVSSNQAPPLGEWALQLPQAVRLF